MSEFAPPTGPPPPRVPEGWKAIFNDQYQEWFYVNIYTKQSTWEKPTEPARDPNAPVPPTGAPPSQHHEGTGKDDLPPTYSAGSNAPATAGQDLKNAHLQSNNPYQSNTAESDAELAKRLQEEENARHGSGSVDRGASDSYYSSGQQQQQQQQGGYPTSPQQNYSQEKPRSSGGGLFGKLKDKLGSSQGSRPMGAPMMGYNAGGYPHQQQQYGGYPQGQGYGGHGYGQNPMGYGPQQGYGGYGGGYGQPMYGQPVKRKGGMGAGGAAALGVGGGLVGGMLLADALDDDDHGDYGGDDGGDMGGDF